MSFTSLSALAVISDYVCNWLTTTTDHALQPLGMGSASGMCTPVDTLPQSSPRGSSRGLLGDTISDKSSSTPLLSARRSGTPALSPAPLSPYRGPGSSSASLGGFRGGKDKAGLAPTPSGGDIAVQVSCALQQGCWLSEAVLRISLSALIGAVENPPANDVAAAGEASSAAGREAQLGLLLGGPLRHAIVYGCRALGRMAACSGGGQSGAGLGVPFALGEEAFSRLISGSDAGERVGVVGSTERAGSESSLVGWGSLFLMIIHKVLPHLPSTDKLQKEQGNVAFTDDGRVDSRRRMSGMKHADGVFEGADVVMELLECWRSFLDAIVALREKRGRDVQGCVDAIQKPLAAAIRYVGGSPHLPQISLASMVEGRQVGCVSDGLVDGSSGVIPGMDPDPDPDPRDGSPGVIPGNDITFKY